MEKQFYSNINCAACITKVSPTLDEIVGENKWKVDTSSRNKELTLDTDAEISLEILNEKLNPLGYKVRMPGQ